MESMEDSLLEFQVLDAVQGNDGSLTQRDISQKIGCSTSSVNYTLRVLAVKGFIKIAGTNPRRLRYHLTPRGLIEKSILAYNFLKRQHALYAEAREGLLHKLQSLRSEGVRRVAVYGWTPLTEACLLYLLSARIKVTAVYMENTDGLTHCNRIPFRTLDEFKGDVDVLILMEPLPANYEDKFGARQLFGPPTA
jgi:DNA-binding Lrp family transcriptional regulator